MSPKVRVLGVYLEPDATSSIRVGTLISEPPMTHFLVSESYLELGPQRPTLSAAYYAPENEANTLRRLQDPSGKVSRSDHVPTTFQHLLPEGALRELAMSQLVGSVRDEFALLERLGADLPGAVVVRTDTEPAKPTTRSSKPPPSPSAAPKLKFSLAGAQLKFSLAREHDRLVFPASGIGGKVIAKIGTEKWPNLCENEFSAMRLAEKAGVRTAVVELVPANAVDGIRRELIHGSHVLAVDRFDRAESSKIHTEEFASVLQTPSSDNAKYGSNLETVVRLIARFSKERSADTQEAIRRITVDLLLGNGDAQLKNWAFIYPDGRRPVLSPAYDIVPTVVYFEDDLALKLGGTKEFRRIGRKRLLRLARAAEISDAELLVEVDRVIERALDTWPSALRDLPMSKEDRSKLNRRWLELPLTRELPNPFAAQRRATFKSANSNAEEIEDVRPYASKAEDTRALTFTVPAEAAPSMETPFSIEYADGRSVPLTVRSLRRSGARTRVIGRIVPDLKGS